MDFVLAGSIAAIVALPLMLIIGAPALLDWIKIRRSQVRNVSARIDQHFHPLDGDYRHQVHNGGRLIIRNSSPWSVHNVMVIRPRALEGLEVESVGADEEVVRDLPESAMQDIDDTTVVLQLEDYKRKQWSWTPKLGKLVPIPSHINPLARSVQWSSRWWPQRLHNRLHRLPKRLQRILWGFDPAG